MSSTMHGHSSNEGDYELGRVRKEVIMTYCKFLSHNLSRQTEQFIDIVSVNGISNFSLFNDAVSKS
jgi:hypothetical protein